LANIVVVFRKIEDARSIRSLLVKNGFSVTAVCSTGSQAIAKIDSLRNGIVVCGYRLTDMMYSELHENMPKESAMLLMAKADVLPDLQENDIVCLPMPTSVRNLVETVSMLERTVEQAVRKRKKQLRSRSQEETEILNKAKNLLMERNNMTEPEAHRYIQKSAMNTGTSLVETAYMVLDLFR
jgi:two-component system, response regulator PdtaR